MTATQRKAIDMAILLRVSPEDSAQRDFANERADFVIRTEPTRIRWAIPGYFGVILALFGLDGIPVLSTVTLIVQVVVLLVCVNSTLTGWRMVRFCREFRSRSAVQQ